MTYHRRGQGGLTLIELMVAMTIGLFLLAGVIGVFVSSKQTYRTNEALSRVQESGRFAMEFIAYDIRMAGLTGCGQTDRIANTLNNPGSWWIDFGSGGIIGYGGATAFPPQAFEGSGGNRIAGTDAFILRGGRPTHYSIESHTPNSANFKLNALHELANGSIVMVCDNRQASIFQVTNVNASNVTVVHNTGSSETPGNCTQLLGFPAPTTCGPQEGTEYQYGPDSMLVEYTSTAYYIGRNQSNGRSLYRISLNAGTPAAPQELVEGLHDMRVVYGRDTSNNNQVNDYVAPGTVTNWNNVLAARVSLLAISEEANVTAGGQQTVSFAGSNVAIPNNRLGQVFTSTVALRNRLP